MHCHVLIGINKPLNDMLSHVYFVWKQAPQDGHVTEHSFMCEQQNISSSARKFIPVIYRELCVKGGRHRAHISVHICSATQKKEMQKECSRAVFCCIPHAKLKFTLDVHLCK